MLYGSEKCNSVDIISSCQRIFADCFPDRNLYVRNESSARPDDVSIFLHALFRRTIRAF